MFPAGSSCRKKKGGNEVKKYKVANCPEKLLHIKEKNSAGGRQSFAWDVQHFIHRDYKTATSKGTRDQKKIETNGPRSIYKQALWSIVCLVVDRHQPRGGSILPIISVDLDKQ
jgi:hypothetical protein